MWGLHIMFLQRVFYLLKFIQKPKNEKRMRKMMLAAMCCLLMLGSCARRAPKQGAPGDGQCQCGCPGCCCNKGQQPGQPGPQCGNQPGGPQGPQGPMGPCPDMQKWAQFDKMNDQQKKEFLKKEKAAVDKQENDLKTKWANFDKLSVGEQQQLIMMKEHQMGPMGGPCGPNGGSCCQPGQGKPQGPSGCGAHPQENPHCQPGSQPQGK